MTGVKCALILQCVQAAGSRGNRIPLPQLANRSDGPCQLLFGSRNSLLIESRTRDQKVASSNPLRSGGVFSSRDLTLCADSYSVSVLFPCYRSGT